MISARLGQRHRRTWAAAIACLLPLLPPCAARAQGLADVAAAGAAAGNVAGGGGGADLRMMNAIKNGAQAAGARGPREAGGEGGGQNGGGAQAGGRNGLILFDQLRDPSGTEEGPGPVEPVPEQYIVIKGDTLWSICDRFFQNPWYWPKLWSYNEIITNPHWIYPGDLISMYPPGQRPAAKPAGAAPERRSGTDPLRRISKAQVGLPSGLFLQQNGFVEPGELDAAGKIIGSKEEKIMLASLDEVYIEVNQKRPLRVGERYTIYRVLKTVRRPYGDKAPLGNVVEILGDVEVRQVTSGGIARAVIREALGPVERGFRVGPLRRTFKLVDAKPNEKNLEGVLIETLQPTSVVGGQALMFFDLGKADGLKEGNRIFVIRRGDGYQRMLSLEPVDDKRFPKEVIAEILILDVGDKTSAGLVMRSTRETRVGDRVEARKGY